ncbi:MAG: hypothetical protein HN341_08605 [Verrucomicrobia bacterium]|jgi:hypothetical protein|nr:hypothetical protein [Verrucomicrobiota bacterium]
MEDRYTFSRLCEILGKAPFYIANLQRSLGIYVPTSEEGYSAAYVSFMEKVVALRTFNVPTAEIVDLFSKETRILELLKFDSLSDSPTWYLDACGAPSRSDDNLLLTGYALGFPLHATAIQTNLDFGKRDDELFDGHEMGEDVSRSLEVYAKRVAKVRARIEKETPVLRNALFWGERVF